MTVEAATDATTGAADAAGLSLDAIVARLTRVGPKEAETVSGTILQLLGLGPDPASDALWPGQAEIAQQLHVTRARISQIVGKLQSRWSKEPAITRVRSDMVELLDGMGGIMTAPELAEALLAARARCRTNRTARGWRWRWHERPSRSSGPWPSRASRCAGRVPGSCSRARPIRPRMRSVWALRPITWPVKTRWRLPPGCCSVCVRCHHLPA